MTEQDRLEELISLYALGVLEGEELKEAELIVGSESPEALELLRDYENVVSMMSFATPGALPDPSLKKKLLEEISGKRATAHKPHRENTPLPLWKRFEHMWLGLGGAVAALLIIALFISNMSLREKAGGNTALVAELNERLSLQESELETLRESLALEESEQAGLETELARLGELSEFLDDPDVVIVKLTDRSPEYDPVGRVHWDKADNKALLVSHNLPDAPEGKTYQWWVMADDAPKSAGVFKVGPDGTSLIKIGSLEDFGRIQDFVLTLEPEGGSERPTGDMLLSGGSI